MSDTERAVLEALRGLFETIDFVGDDAVVRSDFRTRYDAARAAIAGDVGTALMPIGASAALRWIGLDEDSAELVEVKLADGRAAAAWTYKSMTPDGFFQRVYVAVEPLHFCRESSLIVAAYGGDRDAQAALTNLQLERQCIDVTPRDPSPSPSPQGGGERAGAEG